MSNGGPSWMGVPPQIAPIGTELDDEEAYGFRFGQLNLNDAVYSPNPTYVRPPYPYPSSPIYSSPAPPTPYMHQQTPFIPYQQWPAPMSPMPYERRQSSYGEDWQYRPPFQPQPQAYGYAPQFEPPTFRPRMSWSGPKDLPQERKPYHPQPPAKRSDWVMWVGNVPQNTSHEELWRYFNTTIPPGGEPWKGPSSIFLISRSSCAFVNLSSQKDLDRAVGFFNGRPLRGWDPRCPRMVCRVRRKDDDLRSGVGAQRGTGMHREWVKQALPPEGEGRRRESVQQEHKSNHSYASTNSSFLVQHFPRRIFILKSAGAAELEESVKTGTWRTQRHNQPVLDRAFRTAPEVFLIFGANKAGEFFGYARMVEAINKVESRSSGSSSRPQVLSPASSSSIVPMASPSPLTPGIEESPFELKPHRHSHENHPNTAPTADLRPNTLDPKLLQHSSMAGPIAAMRAAERNAVINLTPGSSDRKQEMDDDGVLRKDTMPSPVLPPVDLAQEGMGDAFRIEWVKVAPLPFGRTRHLRNPWNADREVKVSRDGTEVEPNVGTLLLAEWDKL